MAQQNDGIDSPTATADELANRLMRLHHELEEKGDRGNDWSLARALEDRIGSYQPSAGDFDKARELLAKCSGSTAVAKTDIVSLNSEMSSDEAEALSDFLKRVGFSDFRSLAKSDEEAYLMQAGAAKLAQALAEAGYAPR